MALEKRLWDFSRQAGSDLSAKQFYLVKLTASGNCDLTSANADQVAGVIQNNPKSGKVVDITRYGISKVVAGAAFSETAALMSDTSGRAIAQTSTNPVLGYALEAATAAGQIVSVLLAL